MMRKLGVICILAALAGCSFWRAAPQEIKPTATGESPPLSVTPVSEMNASSLPDQAQALLPEARAELDALEGLTHYQIDVEVDPETHSFQGVAVVQVTNREDAPQDALFFRLLPNGHKSYGNGSLAISHARVNGQPVDISLSQADTILQVQLPESLAVGASLEVTLDFIGVIPLDFGGENSGGYGIYNQSQGVIALSGWYPILAVYDTGGWHLEPVSQIGDSGYSDIALYSVDVSAPPEMSVAATGVETATLPGSPMTRHRFISGPARDFFLILSAEFQVASQEVGSVRLNAYGLPENAGGEQAALQVAADALEIYNQNFGPYPLTELDIVAAPMKYALGVEFPGIVLIASNLYEDPKAATFIGTIAHEVAHQWWYNLVGNDVYAEPWLDESLATYSTALYYESGVGKGAYDGYMQYLQGRYDALVADGLDDVVTQPLMYFEELNNPRVYGSVAYTKGALFFDALRQQIGDQAFLSGLQGYYRANKYQIATTQDLLAAFRQTVEEPLDDLIEEWLYSAK